MIILEPISPFDSSGSRNAELKRSGERAEWLYTQVCLSESEAIMKGRLFCWLERRERVGKSDGQEKLGKFAFLKPF